MSQLISVRPHLSSIWALSLLIFTTLNLADCSLRVASGSVDSVKKDSPHNSPNIVLILADDLGWTDLECYGADLHETPRIDQLAGEGVRFTDAYAMPVCSPSRAALLTGRHAARLHITIWSEGSLSGPTNRKLLQAASLHDLPHEEVTLAELLQAEGYLTALVGKWHLGDADHYPETQGFDVNIGGTHWGAPHSFFWPYRGTGRFGPEMRYVPHLEYGQPGEYLTDRLTTEALEVIDRAVEREQPFFLYLAHHAPHTPIEAKPSDIDYFESKVKPHMYHQNATYAAMVKSLDESVGQVLDRIEQHGQTDRTIVVFVSDNGGFIGKDKGGQIPCTSNHPLRSGKGSVYEGGIRVPLIIRWPGITESGGVCREPVILMDLFETLRSVVISQVTKEIDGVNLLAQLKNPDATIDRPALYFHYPHYYPTTTPVGAIRMGDWKLLEYFEDGRVELYHLTDDLGEQHNLAESCTEKTADLLTQLHNWRNRVEVELPSENPNYHPR